MGASQDSLTSENVIGDIDDNIVSKAKTPDDEEADTDLETDRLLGQQRLDDQCFNEDRVMAFFFVEPMDLAKKLFFFGFRQNDWRGTTTSAHIKKSLTLSHLPTTIRQGIGTALHHGSQTSSPTLAGKKEKYDNSDTSQAAAVSPIKSTSSGSGSGSVKTPSDSNEKKKTKEGKS